LKPLATAAGIGRDRDLAGESVLERAQSRRRGQDRSGSPRTAASALSGDGSCSIAGIADFERELLQERIRSGIAAAKARGKRLGRQPGQRPKSDRLTPKVLALVADGHSYRLIARELGLSKNTVLEIVKRNRAMSA
jgi:ATP/maltotriose-dependent transcriptional regulator MalT